jgi:hypothetical protein
MYKRFLFPFVFASLAFAQRTQVGVMIGGGGAAKLFEDSAYHVVAGVEGCVLCAGRVGLFLDYNHWRKTGQGTGNPTSLDLAGGGLRVQGTGDRVRPFLDAGLSVGAERTERPGFVPAVRESKAVLAGMLGFGVAISLTEHWYVRPMAKIGVLSSVEMAGYAGVSVGYRF